jgi:peptide/nickel transport system substrate-binding protein
MAFPVDPRSWKATTGSDVISGPSAGLTMITLPTKTAPWSDIHVRRAVAYAIDKTDLLKAALNGYGTISNTFIPERLLRALGTQAQVDALVKSLPSYPHSLAKARAEMAASAYPKGFSASALLPPGDTNLAQAFASELRPLGIKLDITPVASEAEFIAQATGNKHKTRLYFGTAGPVGPDPGQVYDYFLGSKNIPSGGWNMANYAPTAVDELIKEGFGTANPTKRLAVYGKLLRRLNTDLPYIPLFVGSANLALAKKFSWPTWKDFNGFWYDAGAFTNLIKPT